MLVDMFLEMFLHFKPFFLGQNYVRLYNFRLLNLKNGYVTCDWEISLEFAKIFLW